MSLQKYILKEIDIDKHPEVKELSRIDRENIVYAKLKREAERKFSKMASGSGRVVYDWKNDMVIKLAKNIKGIAQNEAEHTLSQEPYIEDILAKTHYSADNYSFLVSEKAEKLRTPVFKRITGIDWKIFEEYMMWLQEKKAGEYRPFPEYFNNLQSYKIGGKEYTAEEVEELQEKEFVQNITNFIINYDLPVGDFQRKSTYGVVKRNGQELVVIIDYGLTYEVWETHYKK